VSNSDKSSRPSGGKTRDAAIETTFKVGDKVGRAEGDDAVQIEITSIENKSYMVARVIALGSSFSSDRIKKSDTNPEDGFVVGETLLLRGRVSSGIDEWVITTPQNRPWHTLHCRDGVKKFEHYR
jgi:hypothetical protein